MLSITGVATEKNMLVIIFRIYNWRLQRMSRSTTKRRQCYSYPKGICRYLTLPLGRPNDAMRDGLARECQVSTESAECT